MQNDYGSVQRGAIAITPKEATRYDALRKMLDATISLVEATAYMVD